MESVKRSKKWPSRMKLSMGLAMSLIVILTVLQMIVTPIVEKYPDWIASQLFLVVFLLMTASVIAINIYFLNKT